MKYTYKFFRRYVVWISLFSNSLMKRNLLQLYGKQPSKQPSDVISFSLIKSTSCGVLIQSYTWYQEIRSYCIERIHFSTNTRKGSHYHVYMIHTTWCIQPWYTILCCTQPLHYIVHSRYLNYTTSDDWFFFLILLF